MCLHEGRRDQGCLCGSLCHFCDDKFDQLLLSASSSVARLEVLNVLRVVRDGVDQAVGGQIAGGQSGAAGRRTFTLVAGRSDWRGTSTAWTRSPL